MKKVILYVVMACAICFSSACSKDTDENKEEFCSYLNTENIDKTIPIVNEFLVGLKRNLNEEQKLQTLIAWLKSCPCVIDATILCNSCIGSQPAQSEVSILFNENGITKDFVFDVGMTNPLQIVRCHQHYDPINVYVKIKNYYTINRVFEFINTFTLNAKEIYGGVHFSTMSSDSLQYILDGLNSKPYITAWGSLDYYTYQIRISSTLHDMENRDYQNDWLKSMNDYQLIEIMDYYNSGYTIHFIVPEGTEKQWEARFKQHEFVEWAAVSYWGHYYPGPYE